MDSNSVINSFFPPPSYRRENKPGDSSIARIGQTALKKHSPRPKSLNNLNNKNEFLESHLKDHCREGTLKPGNPIWQQLQILTNRMTIETLRKTLESFYFFSNNTNNSVSGYCFLALIKLILRLKKPLPLQENCTFAQLRRTHIRSCLNEFDMKQCPNNTKFIDFILLKSKDSNSPLLYSFIQNESTFKYIQKALTSIPFNKWKNKGRSLASLLKQSSPRERIRLIKELKNSDCDKKTALVGELMDKINSADSLFEAASQLDEIRKTLPHIARSDFPQLFGWPGPDLIDKDHFYLHPKKTFRLNEGFQGPIFPSKFRLASLYRVPNNPATWLMSFHNTTRRLIWGIPLEDALFHIQQTPLGIAFIYKNSNVLNFVNPEDGTISFKTSLPQQPAHGDQMSITSSGYCFLAFGDKLYGVEFSENFRKTKFIEKRPAGELICSEELAGFRNSRLRISTLFSQKGKKTLLPDCPDFLFHQQNLFTLMQSKESTIISKRLVKNGKIFRPTEKMEYPLGALRFIGGIGISTLIFQSETSQKIMLVNFDKKETRELDLDSSNISYYIDKKHNLIWTMDEETKKIQAHSQDESMEIGTLSNSSEAKPIFVGENKVLFYRSHQKNVCLT